MALESLCKAVRYIVEVLYPEFVNNFEDYSLVEEDAFERSCHAFQMKYGPGLKSIVYVHSWNQVAFAYNQDKVFIHRPRKVTMIVLNEDSTAVSK